MSENLSLNPFTAISSVDGRYSKDTKELRSYFSEYGLQRNRVWMEVEYLIYLSENEDITHVRKISDPEKDTLRSLYTNFDMDSMEKIKEIEKTTNHDVKSVEYFIKGHIKDTSLEDLSESIHFALTSEDCTNIAYAKLINDSLEDVMEPMLEEIIKKLGSFAKDYAGLAMPARTHGQYASPTTLGKEFGVYGYELTEKLILLREKRMRAKLNGATGNHSALKATYQNINGNEFTEKFLNKIGLEPKFFTTQVDGYTDHAELFHLMAEINTIIEKMCIDNWLYISYDLLVQKPKDGETGSSTMPHKINPIRFENSEGNNEIANAIFYRLAEKLPKTRMQRDLSGSTMLRAMGTSFGHTLIAWKNTSKGLSRIEPHPDLEAFINDHPETLAEPIQQVLRRELIPDAYEQLAKLTKGRKVTTGDYREFISDLEVKEEVKSGLMSMLKPSDYTGEAKELAMQIVNKIKAIVQGLII